MIIAKRKETRPTTVPGRDGPIWRVLVDGKPTTLYVEKSFEKPRYREPQMWDVVRHDAPYDAVFEAKSLDGALRALTIIADGLAGAA